MKMKLCYNLCALVCFLCNLCHLIELCCGDSVVVRPLETAAWSVRNQNGTEKADKISIPSGVYSVFSNETVLQSQNDVDLRWLSYDNWTYSLKFSVDRKDWENAKYVSLTFHGIDTVAEIMLNSYLLGRTDNMFVRYSYEVKKIMRGPNNVRKNELEIQFISPVYAANATANRLAAQNITVQPNCPPSRYHGECHMNMLRKMQASFGWDWGLAVPSMGIWKMINLEYYEVALIRDIDVAISRNTTHWNMLIRVFLDASGTSDFYAELKFYAIEILDRTVIIDEYKNKPISVKSPVITFNQAIPIERVTLWWPNGYGDQKLYPLHFTLNAWLDPNGPSIRQKTIHQKSIRVGFRTLELSERRAPTGDGNTFLFKVNDQEIFMKGTNYIPSHILPELAANETRIKYLLMAAKDAHMNMIRVWGGGIYESDYFYDMADEYGILIWQDMMFACAMYPVFEEFLSSVRTEVVQNAKRLSRHASVAIFATNNENEAALVQNWYQTFHERKRYEADYRTLYLGTVRHELNIVAHSSRPRPLVSSPSNGKESEKDNYISENPQDTHYGDVHFYTVMQGDGWDANTFPRPRFTSEYGFQSLPKMGSWNRSMSPNDDLMDLIIHRQHHIDGMWPITLLVRRHLPLPLPEDEIYAEALIYFSQIAQAMATKVETELYRSLRDTNVKTMGALYWQLNDVWVAPSWSSIDFHGNYKLLHHWAKDFLEPTHIISLYDSKSDTVNVSLVCDLLEVDTSNLNVTQSVYLWSDLYPKKTTTWPVTLKANGVQYDKVIHTTDIFTGNFNKQNSFVEYTLQRGSKVISHNYYFPTQIKLAEGVKDPELTFELSSQEKHCAETINSVKRNAFTITIHVKHPALFVYIEVMHPQLSQYKLSKNGFMQVSPVQTVYLEFNDDECIRIRSKDIKILTVNQFMS